MRIPRGCGKAFLYPVMRNFVSYTYVNINCVFPFKVYYGAIGNSVVFRDFEWKFIAKKIRIYVLGSYSWPCMRIELYHTGKVVRWHPRSAARSKDDLVNN